jgi:mannan endo-1,4-beta-mannosidase
MGVIPDIKIEMGVMADICRNLYIQQILGSSATHDTFFSNTQIINAYKKYVSFVNRYKSSPAVFAWELCNEPRSTGADNRGKSSACGTGILTS